MHAALIFHIFTKFPEVQKFSGSKVMIISGFLLFAISSATAKTADRCSEPVFGAADIVVDQRAATASEARSIGVDVATQKAFLQVLKRLLFSNDNYNHFIAANERDTFIDFVHIVEEKNLEKRYIAKLDFCFDAERMREAMQAEGLKWAELQSSPILLLPVWKGPDGASAWQKNNQWLSGWRNVLNNYDGLVSLQSLPHNLTHERRFRGKDILEGNPIKLAAAARIAKAEQIMVVTAILDYMGVKRFIDIEARLFDKVGQPITTIIKLPKKAFGKDDSKWFSKVRQTILDKVERSWHSANLINSNARDYLLVSVPAISAKQWSERLEALRGVAVIQDFTIRTLDTRGGTILLELAGSREALENALASYELGLVDTGDIVSIVEKSITQ